MTATTLCRRCGCTSFTDEVVDRLCQSCRGVRTCSECEREFALDDPEPREPVCVACSNRSAVPPATTQPGEPAAPSLATFPTRFCSRCEEVIERDNLCDLCRPCLAVVEGEVEFYQDPAGWIVEVAR